MTDNAAALKHIPIVALAAIEDIFQVGYVFPCGFKIKVFFDIPPPAEMMSHVFGFISHLYFEPLPDEFIKSNCLLKKIVLMRISPDIAFVEFLEKEKQPLKIYAV